MTMRYSCCAARWGAGAVAATAAAVVLMARPTAAATGDAAHAAAKPATPAASAAAAPAPRYVPPRRGAPSHVRLEGGGSRGDAADRPVLTVLAPDHTGLTLQAQPTLYWYVSRAGAQRIEVTIQDDTATRPLLEVQAAAVAHDGFMSVRLADHGARLVPGVEYRWSVALVIQPEQRSADIVSSGVIERVEAPPSLKAALEAAPPRHVPAVLARYGIWYDTIAALGELIAADPHDRGLQEERAGLLEQVGLHPLLRATTVPQR